MIKFILKHFWHNFVDGVKKLHAVIVKNCLTKGNNHLYVYATIISPKSKNLIDYIILKGLPLYSMAQFHFETCPIKKERIEKHLKEYLIFILQGIPTRKFSNNEQISQIGCYPLSSYKNWWIKIEITKCLWTRMYQTNMGRIFVHTSSS